MTGLDHRSPGLAAAALTDDAVAVELIADGEHVHPAVWELIARVKPAGRLILVSDASPRRVWAMAGHGRWAGCRGRGRSGDAGRDRDARGIGHRP